MRDRKDNPITGLSLEQFELRVDGKRVSQNAISVFEETCPDASTVAALPNPPGPAAPTAGQEASQGQESPHSDRGTVLYFDFTALTFEGRAPALAAGRDYFSTRFSGRDETMILAVDQGGVYYEKGFTTDRAALAGAIEELLKDRSTVDLDLFEEKEHFDTVALLIGRPNCIDFARIYAREELARTRHSLDQLSRVVESLKGKKTKINLVLMTDALRLEPGAQYFYLCDATPLFESISVDKPVRDLVAAAEASGISIYTVHSGGLVTTDPANKVGRAEREGVDSAFGLQSTLALETGGRSLRNSNDLTAIIESARRDLDCYYLLGYSPPNAPDGLRHDLQVRINRTRRSGLPRDIDIRHRPFFIDRIP